MNNEKREYSYTVDLLVATTNFNIPYDKLKNNFEKLNISFKENKIKYDNSSFISFATQFKNMKISLSTFKTNKTVIRVTYPQELVNKEAMNKLLHYLNQKFFNV